MAAVTVNNTPSRHVLGDLVCRIFNVSGATGTTLATGFPTILFVAPQAFTAAGTASLITGLSVSGGTVTFTTGGGAMVTEIIEVLGPKS